MDEVLKKICSRGNWLPEELTNELFYRLPLKSLGRFKLVCKRWKSLISDPAFAKSYAQVASPLINPPLTLLLTSNGNILSLEHTADERAHGHNIFEDDNNNNDTLTLNHLHPPFVVEEGLLGSDFFCFGSSCGLVCIYIKNTGLIHLWNPTTNQCRDILFPNGEAQSSCSISEMSWFGFVPSLCDHVILLVTTYYTKVCPRAHVYSMRKDSWRELEVSTLTEIRKTCNDIGPFKRQIKSSICSLLNGALHFIWGCDCEFIVRFNFDGEYFEKIHLSLNHGRQFTCDDGKEFLRFQALLHVSEDKNSLSIWQMYQQCIPMEGRLLPSFKLELWTLERYGDWDSWKILRSIDLIGDFPRILGVSYNGNIVISDTKPLFMIEMPLGNEALVLIDPYEEQPIVARATRRSHGLPHSTLSLCNGSLVSPFSL